MDVQLIAITTTYINLINKNTKLFIHKPYKQTHRKIKDIINIRYILNKLDRIMKKYCKYDTKYIQNTYEGEIYEGEIIQNCYLLFFLQMTNITNNMIINHLVYLNDIY